MVMVSYKLDLKMHMLKQTLNFIAKRVLRLSSGVQPKTPQSKLIYSVWARLEDTVQKEALTGCWNDTNFRNLLNSAKQALIFLCEKDRYYKRWLGLLAMFLTEEVLREKREFSYEKAKECSARPMMLTREEFEKHKDSLFELYMTGYLYGLSLLKTEDIAKIKEARDKGERVQIPSSDLHAFFYLSFTEREKPNDSEERKES